jgi:hypothetical protein
VVGVGDVRGRNFFTPANKQESAQQAGKPISPTKRKGTQSPPPCDMAQEAIARPQEEHAQPASGEGDVRVRARVYVCDWGWGGSVGKGWWWGSGV